ncbi:hypothetical protein FISHEDRAFT_67334 [Fistulina hepatica ATCC 64428]|uniref:Uncharacterized protein n=1 Tax=Fistulina hepatica ATCC 64428 TaxID=1128425 RepID=A0A0D7A4J1_9AGAR|nr:hypothetical protein FISHEDRAFT_67334 [Fistulina hepatica ATCC 64428]
MVESNGAFTDNERPHPEKRASCVPSEPSSNVTARLNDLLQHGGKGFILSLCPNQKYYLATPLYYAAANQEISTMGHPTDDSRAVLVVNGSVNQARLEGHTTAVNGQGAGLDGIDGQRNGASTLIGGGNIEMGGFSVNQTIEYVHSHDPRGWTCMHVSEGSLNCSGLTVQNNEIGPCGSDLYAHSADGISLSCRNSTVRNNVISGATDGGIVIFGSPGSEVYNNTIQIQDNTLLGGINLVDYGPFYGDYTNLRVHDNTILGGFANEPSTSGGSLGTNNGSAVIRVGIAIGPRTWFGSRTGNYSNRGFQVYNNRISGALCYGVALSSTVNAVVAGNTVFGNYNFIGANGPNCTDASSLPSPGPFVVQASSITNTTIQSNFVNATSVSSITCVLPPEDGNHWPYSGSIARAASTPRSLLSRLRPVSLAHSSDTMTAFDLSPRPQAVIRCGPIICRGTPS